MTGPTHPTPEPTPGRRLLVLDVVGLTPRLLTHMPRLSALAEAGAYRPLGAVLPAVTCTVQSTFLTGTTPAGHGIVGNGWYFRDLGEVHLWWQHNALVGGDKIWDAARRARPGYTVANVCWWYAMGADTDWTVTPRPVYYADGRKEPDCYTRPPDLHDELTELLGPFPLFTYWGPPVRGSHGLLPADPADGPVLICSQPDVLPAAPAATDVKPLLLRLAGLT